MDLFTIVLIALSLSVDCFAIAVCASACLGRISRWQVGRTSAAFGFAQFLMPVAGWLAGRTVVNAISSFDHWVAFGLLGIVGGRMLWGAFKNEDDGKEIDITAGFQLVTLSIATSIDALAVGLSFAFLETKIIQASVIIGLVTVLVTVAGFWIGRKAGGLLGQRAKFVGGIVLLGIGARILITHLAG